ncbi:MAG: CRTAC1 family protein [Acidimicrobiia bacterium]|nr:CRTAC1 family protein [Acidimicrobiia bacterium]
MGGRVACRRRGTARAWTVPVALVATALVGAPQLASDPLSTRFAAQADRTPSRPLPTQSAGAWFTDRAREVGLDFVHFNGMSGEFYFEEMMGSGAALLDFDNDGDLDVYLIQGQMLGVGRTLADALIPPRLPLPLSDRLYRNDLEVRADGTRTLRFTDVTSGSGLDVRSYGMGVATGDFDNDGRIDVYRTRRGPGQMFRNNGDGTFTDVSARTGTRHPGWSVSASFIDIDHDGWLDLYVGNYVDNDDTKKCFSALGERDYCGPQGFKPMPDRLYRNRGDGTFTDVTATANVAREYGPALGVVGADVNGDGWTDIYVANDMRENVLWLNQRNGTFKNGALLAGVAVNQTGAVEAGMGVDAGDVDNDGDEDLFVTNLGTQKNTLYVNDGSGLFEDRSTFSRLGRPNQPNTGFGTLFFDYDNDGWLDVLVANGAVYTKKALAAAKDPYPLHEINQLFRNLGNGTFKEVTSRAGAVFGLSEVSRGAAFGDVDNDGDMDVVVTNNSGPVRLLINDIGHRSHWLGLRLVGGKPGRDMLGARVGVYRGEGPPLWRRARTDGSYASAQDPRVLVGLGRSTTVPRVRVIWPSGRVEEWTNLAIDRWRTLTEGTGRTEKGAR